MRVLPAASALAIAATGVLAGAVSATQVTTGLPTLTYAQAPREPRPVGKPDVAFLLAPLYGGSSPLAQMIAPDGGTLASLQTGTIDKILFNTERQAFVAFYGTPLSYYTRLDLSAAAGYFGNVTGALALAPTDRVSTFVSIANGGLLEANGTIAGSTVVNQGGTLSGNGTVASVNVLSGGTLAPGASTGIGTLNVAGSLVFAPGSSYAVRATPAQADETLVSGKATLGGAGVTVNASGTTFLPRTRYTIVKADGGVSGSFGAVTTNLAFLVPTLTYDANDAYLNLARNDVSFTAVAATNNQRTLGAALTGIGARPTSDGGSAILNGIFTLSAPAARATYDQLSGEGLVASQNTNIRAGRAFTGTVGDQITLWRVQPTVAAPVRELADLSASPAAAAAPVRHYRLWASGDGGALTIDANPGLGTARQRADFYGGDVGADTEVAPGLLLGGSLGGSGTDFDVSQRASSGTAVGFHASIYGAFLSGSNYLQSITSFSDFSNTTSRAVGGFGGLGVATERASFNSTEIRERLEAGRSFSRDAGFGTPEVRLTPFVALEIARLTTGAFNEYTTNGAPNTLGLQSFGQSVADVPGFLGVRVDSTTAFGGLTIHPVLSLAYLHEFAPQRNLTNGFLSLPGATFLVQGARPAINAAQVKLGAETSVGHSLSIFANFEGEFAGVEQVYGGKGGLRYTW